MAGLPRRDSLATSAAMIAAATLPASTVATVTTTKTSELPNSKTRKESTP